MGNPLREQLYKPTIPVTMSIGMNLWVQHGPRLLALMRQYRGLFPDVPEQPPVVGSGDAGVHEKTYVIDAWGTTREFIFGGIDGMSKSYPLADWSMLETYVPPDPLMTAERQPRDDWNLLSQEGQKARRDGRLVWYYIGEFHERMYYLRGFDRYLLDLAEEPPQLATLREIIITHNVRLIRKCLQCGANVFVFHDDLGNQTQLMMRPDTWRKWLKPGYQQMWSPIKEAGQYIYLHSDGMILDILPELIELGLDVINPQVGVNGIDAIAGICKGRICIRADLDDQDIIPHGSPQDIRDHVREVVVKLGSPEGGLGLEAKLIGPVPWENLEALFSCVDELRFYYSDASAETASVVTPVDFWSTIWGVGKHAAGAY
jgi:uroporphyrinogen decarboxylase